MADDVFDHDHGTVDDHAEVQRAERKQVGGNVAQVEADGREEQREGDGESNDDCTTHVAEEEEKDDYDENDSFGQVVQHGMRGQMHQVAAIEEGNNFDALGQNFVVDLLDLFFTAFSTGSASAPLRRSTRLPPRRDCR